ncbi:ras-related protein Rab-3C-like [Oppia nitens]|uniref:ras-related protein Rab-3C-like n=1 Tax=Oppia nitens TaxID=1686743 RepID=UPI0023DC3570|nr:ras-related protein Rab-3C-like [Oppia nitens]
MSSAANCCTVGLDFKIKTLIKQTNNDANKQSIRLQIWDMGGQDCFRTITSLYYRKASGCLLIDNAPDRAQVVLVGNKCDISDGSDDDNQQQQQPKRVISYEMD